MSKNRSKNQFIMKELLKNQFILIENQKKFISKMKKSFTLINLSISKRR